MSKTVHVHVHNHATRDGWEESKHPRADDGKFGSGGGSSSGKESNKPAAKKVAKTKKPATMESLNGKHTKAGGDHPDKKVMYDKQGQMHTLSSGLAENREKYDGWRLVPADELNKKHLI